MFCVAFVTCRLFDGVFVFFVCFFNVLGRVSMVVVFVSFFPRVVFVSCVFVCLFVCCFFVVSCIVFVDCDVFFV